MTLTHLRVKDFQSLHDVELTLAPLTIVVGPSSSGKSALIRALKTLTANARGSAFVSTWATKTVIEADFADRVTGSIHEPDGYQPLGSLTLTRSAKTGDDSYVISRTATSLSTSTPHAQDTYTKLSGTVPPEVTAFLRVEPTPESLALHFASQFDRPYLLGDSPAEVARTFAQLTNAHVIFAAAREANRSRLQAAQTLKIRVNDLLPITAQIPGIRHLAAQRAHLSQAEAALLTASDLHTHIKNLQAHRTALQWADETIVSLALTLARPVPTLTVLTAAHSAYQRLTALTLALSAASLSMERTAPLLARSVPNLAPVLQANDDLSRYRAALTALTVATHAHRATAEQSTLQDSHTAAEIKNLNARHTALLNTAGLCPTCGQSTTHLIGASA